MIVADRCSRAWYISSSGANCCAPQPTAATASPARHQAPSVSVRDGGGSAEILWRLSTPTMLMRAAHAYEWQEGRHPHGFGHLRRPGGDAAGRRVLTCWR